MCKYIALGGTVEEGNARHLVIHTETSIIDIFSANEYLHRYVPRRSNR